MKSKWVVVLMVMCAFLLAGCRTLQPDHRQQEAQQSLETIAEAMAGRSLSEEEVRSLKNRIRDDQETQSAIEAISGQGGHRLQIKYCPLTGKRYSATLERCPEHGVELKWVDE